MFIKLPIGLINSQQVELALADPETEYNAIAYFDTDSISCIRVAHDERLSESLNLEASCIHLKSGESFMVYMHIDELLDLLKEHITCL